MDTWRKQLKYDPLSPLLASGNKALLYFTRRDLLGEDAGPVSCLWELPEAQRILKKQLPEGSWPTARKSKHEAINHRLIETWRHFRFLVEQFGFTRDHPKVERAAEFMFSCQTQAGDIRGILANQYATYYTGAIMESLIHAGYGEDPRIERGFDWLLSMRQFDQGWTIPILTHKLDRATQYRLTSQHAEPVEPDRARPFSHNWTGMVLRAFAVHQEYRSSQAARIAGNLLKSRFFQQDAYSSYKAASYWVRFEYPYWWNNLLSALDSLSLIGFTKADAQIQQALDWFQDNQEARGLWKVTYAKPEEMEKDTARFRERKLWVSLAICRVFRRFYI
jgi:hypothetical protein